MRSRRRRLGFGLVAAMLGGVIATSGWTSAGAAAADPTDGWIAPPDVQIGSGNVSLKCNVEMFGIPLLSQTMQVTSTGAVPTIVRPGQTWTVTDGQVQVALPASLANQLVSLGVTKIVAHVTKAQFTESGANNATVDATKSNTITVPTITVQKNQPLVIHVGYDKPLNVGPFPAPNPGITHFGLGTLSTSITAYLFGSIPILLPLSTSCPAPDPAQLLATVNVAGPPGTGNVAPTGSYTPADVGEDSITGTTGAQYACTAGTSTAFTMNVSMTASSAFGARGLVMSPGEQVPFNDGHGYIRVDKAMTAALLPLVRRQAHGGSIVALRPTMSQLEVTAVDASPADANFVTTPVDGESFALTATGEQDARFPKPGIDLTPFFFTAGSSGVLDIFLGAAGGAFQGLDAAGNAVGAPIPVHCASPQPAVPLFPAVIAS